MDNEIINPEVSNPDGEILLPKPPEAQEEEVVEEQPEKTEHPEDVMFEVPQEDDNDIRTDDLFEIDEEDLDPGDEGDLSDITRVTNDDLMGGPLIRRSPRKPKRIIRRYNPPPTMGGLR